MKRHDEWLIIRGDHNASVGKLEQKLSSTKARGKYGCGASNEAGRDLIAWCEMNGMTWANSFMSHPDRGTWFHQRYGRWHCDLLPDQVCLTAGKTQRNNSIVFSLSSIIEHY